MTPEKVHTKNVERAVVPSPPSAFYNANRIPGVHFATAENVHDGSVT